MSFKRVLFVTAVPYMRGVSRLPREFRRAGIHAAVLCASGSYIEHTRYVDQVFHFDRRLRAWPTWKLLKAVWTWRPDLIVPGDDWSAQWLATLATERLGGLLPIVPSGLCRLLTRSLGRPDGYPILGNKRRLQGEAQRLGVRTPDDQRVVSMQDACRHAEALGYPVVLKTAHGMGGTGVQRCRNVQELEGAYGSLSAPSTVSPPDGFPTVREGLRRAMGLAAASDVDEVSLQRFVVGTPVMHTFSAWEGRVLAGMTGVKEQVHPAPFGPSSVLQMIRHPEIESAASRLVGHFGLSGIASFDFMMDRSGRAFLLECNPRPTPIAHLGRRFGADLIGALRRAVEGRRADPPKYGTEGWISLFPQEFLRDPEGDDRDRYPVDLLTNDDSLLAHILDRDFDEAQQRQWRARPRNGAKRPVGTGRTLEEDGRGGASNREE